MSWKKRMKHQMLINLEVLMDIKLNQFQNLEGNSMQILGELQFWKR